MRKVDVSSTIKNIVFKTAKNGAVLPIVIFSDDTAIPVSITCISLLIDILVVYGRNTPISIRKTFSYKSTLSNKWYTHYSIRVPNKRVAYVTQWYHNSCDDRLTMCKV